MIHLDIERINEYAPYKVEAEAGQYIFETSARMPLFFYTLRSTTYLVRLCTHLGRLTYIKVGKEGLLGKIRYFCRQNYSKNA